MKPIIPIIRPGFLRITLLWPIIVTALVLVLLVNWGQVTAKTASPDVHPARSPLSDYRSISETLQVSLPLVRRPSAPPRGNLGTDFGNMLTETAVISDDLPLAVAMGTSWTRVELPWLIIEPGRGEYAWEPYDALFARLQELEVKPLVVIHSIPDWASDPADKGCGPITDWVAFESFVDAAIKRYGTVVTAWEFINEPDGFEPSPLGPTIGCWARYSAKYAEQLAMFHSLIKQRQPDSLVFFGGLAYDNWTKFDRNFLANTLESGAGQYFDGVSLHFYPINPEEFPSIADKIQEIQDILGRYLLWDKKIWITETSMWSNGTLGLEAQKDFIVQEQARAFCAGADNLFWFAIRQESFDPPLARWLINREHQPDQGYFTYKAFAQALTDTVCLDRPTNLPADVDAYRFQNRQGKILYVVWSSANIQTVRLAAAVQARVVDRDGEGERIIMATNGFVTIEVGAKAQYVWID